MQTQMHSSRWIMQTANSRDNRRTSEWEDTRRIKGNKLFRDRREGEVKFYLPLVEDNGFSRYSRNFIRKPPREKLARATRHADKS